MSTWFINKGLQYVSLTCEATLSSSPVSENSAYKMISSLLHTYWAKILKSIYFILKPKIIDISVSQHLLKLCSRTWVWAQNDPRFNYQYITKKSFKSMSHDRDHFTPLLLIISIINLTIYYVRPREELRGSYAVL